MAGLLSLGDLGHDVGHDCLYPVVVVVVGCVVGCVRRVEAFVSESLCCCEWLIVWYWCVVVVVELVDVVVDVIVAVDVLDLVVIDVGASESNLSVAFL